MKLVSLPAGDVLIRPMLPEDAAFASTSWLSSAVEFAAEQYDLPKDQRGEVESLLRACMGKPVERRMSSAQVKLVACDPSSPSSLFGFVVADPGPAVHFLFVKWAARRQGIASTLLEAAMEQAGAPSGSPIRCTSWGRCCAGLAPRLGLVFDPAWKRKI